MEQYEHLNFEKLPSAVSQILGEISEIKKLLLIKHKREPTDSCALSVDKAIKLMCEEGYQISKSQLYKLTSNNTIPFAKFGKRLIFDERLLIQWIKTRIERENTNADSTISISKSAHTKITKKT